MRDALTHLPLPAAVTLAVLTPLALWILPAAVLVACAADAAALAAGLGVAELGAAGSAVGLYRRGRHR